MKCATLGWVCEQIHQVVLAATATQVLRCAVRNTEERKKIFINSVHKSRKQITSLFLLELNEIRVKYG
jgi:hypothetical protein